MKLTRLLKGMALLVSTSLLFACGGGDGSKGTVVNGKALAGVFKSGSTVIFKGYSGANKDKEYEIIRTTTVADTGSFTANIGDYQGVLKVEVSGTYTDEATGKEITVTQDKPLKAALPSTSVSNGVTVPVTPLTSIAVETAGTKLTDATVTTSNKAISALFGIEDVAKTIPVAANTTSLTGVTDQKALAYTSALVTLSQYVANYAQSVTGNTDNVTLIAALPEAIERISKGVTISGTGTNATASITAPEVAHTMEQATKDVNTNVNLATVKEALSTSASTVTAALNTNTDINLKSIKAVTLQVVGQLPTGKKIYGIQFDLGIGEGVEIKTGANGVLSDGTATATGAGLGSLITGKLTGGTLSFAIANASGFATGNFVTIYYTSAATFTPTGFRNIKIVDAEGYPINGLTIAAQ